VIDWVQTKKALKEQATAGFACTSDLWTSEVNRTSLQSITATFLPALDVEAGQRKIYTMLIDAQPLPTRESHTAEIISMHLLAALQSVDAVHLARFLVTDTASNMLKLDDELPKRVRGHDGRWGMMISIA
jgi:hypothetical protein